MILNSVPTIVSLFCFIIQKEEVEELIAAIDINNPKYSAAIEELTQIYCDCLSVISL